MLIGARHFEPAIANALHLDAPYFRGGNVTEPSEETDKCLQSWGAIQALQASLASTGDIFADITRTRAAIDEAIALYQDLGARDVNFETSTSRRHLPLILEALNYLERQL